MGTEEMKIPLDSSDVAASAATREPAPPSTVVIFGATGDLTKRKLVPALFNLAAGGLLPDEFAIVGFGRTEMSSEQFRDHLRGDLSRFATRDVDPGLADWLIERIYYTPGNFKDPASFERLETLIQKAEGERKSGGSRIYYLATPPPFFADIVHHLGEAKMIDESEGKFRRVIIEKPFGHDLDSAKELNQQIREVLEERQIYRIDH